MTSSVLYFANLLSSTILPFAGMVVLGSLYLKKHFNARKVMQLRPDYYSKILAQVVLATLHDNQQLQTANQDLTNGIIITELENGYYRYSLTGYTHKDNELFLNALSQLFAQIKTPRYIISLVKKPTIADIFPVPNMFGVNKKTAQLFSNNWQKYLTTFKHTHLISSSSEMGQELLLKIRANQYSQTQADEIQLIDRWE